jgi:hypothetical protein
MAKTNALYPFQFRTHTHTQVDECDRLWIVDCGVTDLLGAPKKFRNPSVLVFDLNNNGELIRHFEIPENQIKADSFFVNVVSDLCSKQSFELPHKLSQV